MKVAVYSGSFNPLHIGHLAIIRHMIEKAGFDMVYLIVSPKNPLKDSISSATGHERYLAAIEAVNRHFRHSCPSIWSTEPSEDIPDTPVLASLSHPLAGGGMCPSCPSEGSGCSTKVKVDDIELTMPEPHYTIRTLNALRAREPENSFTLVIGADNLADIRRWRDYGSILKDFGVAVFPRAGHDLETIKQDLLEEDPAYKIQIADAPLVNISSTEIREAVLSGKDASHLMM